MAIYYIKTGGNDALTGLSDAQAWSFTKLASFVPAAGDQILFNRGDTFYGSLTITVSGTDVNRIVYGAYGTGDKPIITGFTTVSSWTNLGSNIWESTSTVSNLLTANVVFIDDVNTGMGRTPNAGSYYWIDSHVTNTSLTSSSLVGTDWTRAEACIRISRYKFDRKEVASQVGGTITLSTTTTQNIGDNRGFWMQNELRFRQTGSFLWEHLLQHKNHQCQLVPSGIYDR